MRIEYEEVSLSSQADKCFNLANRTGYLEIQGMNALLDALNETIGNVIGENVEKLHDVKNAHGQISGAIRFYCNLTGKDMDSKEINDIHEYALNIYSKAAEQEELVRKALSNAELSSAELPNAEPR